MILLILNIALACNLECKITKVAVAHNIDKALLTAIVHTESRGIASAYNHRTKDYGLAQINYKTAKALGYDTARLLSDETYNLNAAATILKQFKKQYHSREPATWPCRYNIGNQRLPTQCLNYMNKLYKNGYSNKGGTK